MIITRASLARTPGTQGSLAKVLLAGASSDGGHGLVWTLFSRADDRTRDFQYRVIEPGRFLVVSQRPPEDPHGLWHLESKPYAPELTPGDRLGFVLRANPVIRLDQKETRVDQKGRTTPKRKKVDVVMHAKHDLDRAGRRDFGSDQIDHVALDWLIARGPALGVTFDRLQCSATGYTTVAIPQGERARSWSPKPIRFSQIDFEGRLTVVDPVKLIAALHSGIGSAKAYGCGLMLLRRAPPTISGGDDDDD